MDQETYTAEAEERAHGEAEKRAARARAEELDDFKWMMNTKRGRRQIWRALVRAKVFNTTLSESPHTMAFAEGAKREGYYLIGMIHAACPDKYADMVKENANG